MSFSLFNSLVPLVSVVWLTVSPSKAVHFIIIILLKLLFLVVDVWLIARRMLRPKIILIIHIIVLEVLLDQVVIMVDVFGITLGVP